MKKIIFLLVFTISLPVLPLLGQYPCQKAHYRTDNKVNYNPDTRSDSIDIEHISLYLDFHELDGMLSANATLEFDALVNNIAKIDLDLLNFTVDSVVQNNSVLAFDYNTELLQIYLSDTLDAEQNTSVTVYYHGEPTTDASGFGGLDYIAGYAYNMGVGFLADPHVFGRSWFPCFDNFVERSTYEFHVLTNAANYAYCNGAFISREEIGEDSLITIWQMDNTIPSYLASIGVTNYTQAEQLLEGIAGDIPAYLIARPQDTTDMKNTFVNLPVAFSTFENSFGPYRWNKVGYNLVPNSGGAMEHATNIAFPKVLANGNLTYQYIMAHELAHHWWGDLVTCSTQEDMWINEGMASYCEQLFFENLEGEDSYISHVRNNHKDVFFNAADDDGAWLAVSGIGSENTYGSTVYNKGSDVAHVLRSYLEDPDFFGILTDFLDDNQFSDVSSEEMRDYIVAHGTDANINAYFDNWIFNPGFPEFEIANQEVESQGDSFVITLDISQNLYHAPELYTDVPMVIRVVDDMYNTEDFRVIVSGSSTAITITTSLEPKAIYLNPKDKISQAVFGDNIELSNTGTENLAFSEFRVKVNELGAFDSYWFRSECHYADADPLDETTAYKLSNDRFWRVRMFGTAESDATDIEGRIKFNGNPSSSVYRDETFFMELEDVGLTEDSLVLMYRADGNSPWQPYENYNLLTAGNTTNWVGSFDILGLHSGDYTWAYEYADVESIDNLEAGGIRFIQGKVISRIVGTHGDNIFIVYDSLGREVLKQKFNGEGQIFMELLPAGSYVVKVSSRDIISYDIFQFVVD